MNYLEEDEKKPLNPLVMDYLMKKKQAQEQYDQQSSRADTGNLFSNLGDVIAGKQVGSANGYFDKVRANAKSDTLGKVDADEKQSREDYAYKRSVDQNKITDDQRLRDTDPNSDESKMARSLAVKMGMNPQAASSLTAAKFQQSSPVLQKMYEIEQKKLDRADARSEKQKVLSQKAQELSTTQAKQAGLYKSGALAEDQFVKATSDKNDYDPTSSGQWIDNSNWAPNLMKNDKAIETKSAKDSWIESFLRDASGAAIAPSERSAYADIYFPSPGDTDDVVKNKSMLRQQKMESAAESAGLKAQKGLKEFTDQKLGGAQTKKVNGVTYKKVQGGWEPVGG